MKIYVVWDNQKNEFYTRNRKTCWSSKRAAKNAVMYDGRTGSKTFATQSRYVVREYDLEKNKEFDIV